MPRPGKQATRRDSCVTGPRRPQGAGLLLLRRHDRLPARQPQPILDATPRPGRLPAPGGVRDRQRAPHPGHGAEAGTVTQEDAVAGFAPKTGGPPPSRHPVAEDRYDLLFATDVLSEGVNLQQARNIVNYDLPWNPMRLVQRHGRVDRIGSAARLRIPVVLLPRRAIWTGCSTWKASCTRKLTKAAKSIGTGKVLPGVEASDDVVFNARRDQIQATRRRRQRPVPRHERRPDLRRGVPRDAPQAIETRVARRRGYEAMPWGIGSGFTASRPRCPGSCSAPASSTAPTNQHTGSSPCPPHCCPDTARRRRTRPRPCPRKTCSNPESLRNLTAPTSAGRRRPHRRHAHRAERRQPA